MTVGGVPDEDLLDTVHRCRACQRLQRGARMASMMTENSARKGFNSVCIGLLDLPAPSHPRQ
jgi:hypothetical protein